MLCRRCNTVYETLACPGCMARVSREATLAQQRLLLPRIVAGKDDLRLARRRHTDPWHLELLQESTHAYCGVSLASPMVRTRARYGDPLLPPICEACLEALDECLRAEAS